MAVQEMKVKVVKRLFGINTASLPHFHASFKFEYGPSSALQQGCGSQIIRAPGSHLFSTPDHFVIETAFSTGGDKKACAHV